MAFTTLDPPSEDTGSRPEMTDIDWNELKPSQVTALAALNDGHTISEAAKLAGVARSTLTKWIAEDASFIRAYQAVKFEALDSVSRKLTRLGIKATDTLEHILDNSANDAIRLRAATDTLNLILKSIEVFEPNTTEHVVTVNAANRIRLEDVDEEMAAIIIAKTGAIYARQEGDSDGTG